MADAAALHREMFDTIQRQDLAALRDLYHDAYEYRGPDGVTQPGADAGVAVAETYTKAFPDLRVEVLNQVAAGSVSAIELIAHGTHRGDLDGVAPTGKQVAIPGCNVITVEDGKILRESEYFDTAVLLEQLGVQGA